MQNSFQQYVDNRYNIKTLGPYDFLEFIKKMREPEFKEKIYNDYSKSTIFIPPKNLSPIVIPK